MAEVLLVVIHWWSHLGEGVAVHREEGDVLVSRVCSLGDVHACTELVVVGLRFQERPR